VREPRAGLRRRKAFCLDLIIQRAAITLKVRDVQVRVAQGHGAPDFVDWPRASGWTEQQVYEERPFRGLSRRLTLMVTLAANSEDIFGGGDNSLPRSLRHGVFQNARMPGRHGTDTDSLQSRYVRLRTQAYILSGSINLEKSGTYLVSCSGGDECQY